MSRVTSKGLIVWDQSTDAFSHTQLAANWDLVDSYWAGFNATTKLPQRLHTTTTVPTTGTAGDIVMLTAADGGFAAWTVLRYDGSVWRAVGPIEVLAALPSAGLYAGRMVILSAASGGFSQWSVVRYDGSSWGVVGGLSNVNSSGVVGLSTAGDLLFTSAARGPILIDRTTGQQWRLFVTNGKLEHEIVT